MSENYVPEHALDFEVKQPFLSNKAYDTIKWITLIFLPACGTLYYALALIWGLPAAEAVVGTVVAVETFLGACVGLASKDYKDSNKDVDGVLAVDGSDPEKGLYAVRIAVPSEGFGDKVTLKVNETR